MQNMQQQAYLAALEWHLLHGCDEMLLDTPQDHLCPKPSPPSAAPPSLPDISLGQTASASSSGAVAPISSITGTQALKQEALDRAAVVQSLDDLAKAIQDFEGLDIKKTATNFVFADGSPEANIMLVGEAPGADEDRQGKPFVGVSGQLLDKILACIGLDRHAEDPHQGIYISNVLNWRPPGNRTPTPQEMEISLPFIEKHIALVNPDYLILCGGVAANTLLHNKDSISKLRGKKHLFSPQTLSLPKNIPAIATYHPSYLLRTPSQKAKVWQDMLFFQSLQQSTTE